MLDLGPLLFEPRLVPKIWGGRRLEAWGKKLPPALAIGESWELYDDAQGSPQCCQGPLLGRSLAELGALWGRSFYGPVQRHSDEPFPLLVKLLDAQEDLSVQVHPSDDLARSLHGPGAKGKMEMWVVLEAAPGARVLNGFKSGVTWNKVREAVAETDPLAVANLLNSISVRAGDVIDVPAGRPHAIGAGCLVAEVQQNSDWTYRLWDYGRLEQGRPRALHLKEAEKALRFDAVGMADGRVLPRVRQEPWGRREPLISNAFFKVERWTLKPGAGVDVGGSLRALMALSGTLGLNTITGVPPARIMPGQTALVPAALSLRLEGASTETVLLSIEAV